MLLIERDSKVPLYEQIYKNIVQGIESGLFPEGSRLPSVRYLAAENGVSKITVEQAYTQLAAEGYIKAHNRSPYEVMPLGSISDWGMKSNEERQTTKKRDKQVDAETETDVNENPYDYNFGAGNMDPEGFDYTRWKRMIGHVLRNPEALMGYGDERGELVLRQALRQYLQDARAVSSEVNRIVIGSGTQAMLQILASLLKYKNITRIGVEPTQFSSISRIFSDYGFTIIPVPQKNEHLGDQLKSLDIEVYYCTPSHEDEQGRIMPIGQRQQLLQWASQGQRYIIEDDYDSELRYYGRPIPSLQGMDGFQRVIYLGTPSKVLPPSIRLSYMVLPDSLHDIFTSNLRRFRQSASLMEQLVWAEYIMSGEWGKQIRRLRKHYNEKSRYMVQLIKEKLGSKVSVNRPEGGVYITLAVDSSLSPQQLAEKAKEYRCKVRTEEGSNYVYLSFSGITTTQLPTAIEQLSQAWKEV